MSELPVPILLAVLRGVKTLFERDVVANAGLWRPVPRTIQVGFEGAFAELERPLIAVAPIGPGRELEARPLGHGRTQATLSMVLATRDNNDPDAAILYLWTAVRRTIRSNLNLTGIDPDPGAPAILVSGKLNLGEHDMWVTGPDGVVEQDVVVDYVWSTARP